MKHIDLMLETHQNMIYLKPSLEKLVHTMINTYNNGGKIMICGNGGSASDADHIVGELMKGFMLKRPLKPEEKQAIIEKNFDNGEYIANSLHRGFPAISLNVHNALISAIINDISADMVYAQEVNAIGQKGDILIGISTSGNAENVCNGLKVAQAKGITCVGMTGNKKGKMNQFCDIILDAPESETYKIQECHIALYHAFCAEIEEQLFE